MNRYFKSLFVSAFLCLAIFNPAFCAEETITFTTYYPSPTGSYKEMRAARIAIGDNYLKPEYCWEGSCANAIAPAADLVVEGNVGIGTVGPTAKLNVRGNTGADSEIRIHNSLSNDYARLRFLSGGTEGIQTDGAAGEYLIRTAFGGGGGFRIYEGTDSSDSNVKFIITQGGSVGIGTTGPGALLHLNGASGAFPATIGKIQTGHRLRLSATGQTGVLDIGTNGGNGAWLQNTDKEDLSLNYKLLLNPNGGNVGIGTTNPLHKLVIKGGASFANLELNTDTYGGFIQVYDRDAAVPDYKSFRINTSSGNGFYQDTSGNVGIGATDPQTKLDVNGPIRTRASTVTCNASNVGTIYYDSTLNFFYGCSTGGPQKLSN